MRRWRPRQGREATLDGEGHVSRLSVGVVKAQTVSGSAKLGYENMTRRHGVR